MKKIKNIIALCVLILQALMGCKGNETKHLHHEPRFNGAIAVEQYVDSLTEEGDNESLRMGPSVVHSFLGKEIVLDNSVLEQISAIVKKDKMLSYDNAILKIGDVEWAVNIDAFGVVLITDVQPDAPEMQPVVYYLTSIYGKPYDDEEDGFDIKWSSSADTLNLFNGESTLIHLRRVQSDEGGTVIFFLEPK